MFGFGQMDNHPLANPQSLATIAPYFFMNISFDNTQCTLLILYIFILLLFLFLCNLYHYIMPQIHHQGRTQDFKLGGAGDKQIFFFSNTYLYSINKLSTKTNIKIQSSTNKNKTHETLLRYNHLKLGNEYFLGLKHRHFLELGNEYFLELEHPHFLELE